MRLLIAVSARVGARHALGGPPKAEPGAEAGTAAERSGAALIQ
jgi:hypothetical protein